MPNTACQFAKFFKISSARAAGPFFSTLLDINIKLIARSFSKLHTILPRIFWICVFNFVNFERVVFSGHVAEVEEDAIFHCLGLPIGFDALIMNNTDENGSEVYVHKSV